MARRVSTEPNRRRFLLGGCIALGVVTAGLLTPVSRAMALVSEEFAAHNSKGKKKIRASTASFGWELTDIENNGANVSFEVKRAMTLTAIDVDIAFMLTALPAAPGFTEVLCTGSVSRGGPPTFSSGPQAYTGPPASADFGTIQLHNPNNLNGPYNMQLAQDQFLAVIIKAWAPTDGTASSTERHVHTTPSLHVNAGDYLVFHMDHAGVGGDVEMQVVLGYEER
jgi:hypothetical protein